MLRVKNNEEAEEMLRSGLIQKCYPEGSFSSVEKAVRENVGILTESYGNDGAGGYLAVIEKNVRSDEGSREYEEELLRFRLERDWCEFSDVLFEGEGGRVKLQLFAMTEYNLLLLFWEGGKSG